MGMILTMGEMLVEIMRPQAGIPLNEIAAFVGPFPSGAPAIFIDTAAKLGHSAGIIGGVADDDFGKCLLDRLASDGVDISLVKVFPNLSTAVAFVTYFKDGSRQFIFHIDGTPAVKVRFEDKAVMKHPEYFHVMGCSLMANDDFREEIFKAVDKLFQAGAKISFDPNIREELLGDKNLNEVIGPVLEKTAILMPGESELLLLSGKNKISEAVDSLFVNENLELIVNKRGKDGAKIFTRNKVIETPAYPIKEVDPTGAGDCFDAAFLCGLLEGKALKECGKMAAAAGALNASAFGPMEGKINQRTIADIINQ